MSKTNLIKNKTEYPDFEEIVQRCKELMDKKSSKYGNSWKETGFPLQWWHDRMQGELDEIKKAKTVEEALPELLDLINIVAMHYHNMALTKCSVCGKFLITFHIMDGKPRCSECYIG